MHFSPAPQTTFTPGCFSKCGQSWLRPWTVNCAILARTGLKFKTSGGRLCALPRLTNFSAMFKSMRRYAHNDRREDGGTDIGYWSSLSAFIACLYRTIPGILIAVKLQFIFWTSDLWAWKMNLRLLRRAMPWNWKKLRRCIRGGSSNFNKYNRLPSPQF